MTPQLQVVLIAEDEPLIRMVACETLVDAGFSVIEAEHADAALAALHDAATRVDVLFTDVQMPGSMNGAQLAHCVHAIWPAVRLLVTSGNAKPVSPCLPQPARFLAKPYDGRDVVGHIKALLAPQ